MGASPSGEDPEPVDRGVEATIPIGQGFAQDPESFGDTHHESTVISSQPPFITGDQTASQKGTYMHF